MIEWLNQIDVGLFQFLNSGLANPVFDALMPIVTSDMYLRVAYGLAMALLLIKGDARLRWLVLFSAVALTLTDQASSALLKPLIARARPCQVMDTVNLLVGCGSGYAMPSSHAANAFGQAVLFSLLFKKIAPYLMLFAALVAISRILVGVHYPGDVLVGSLLGIALGWFVAWAFERLVTRRLAIDRTLPQDHQ
jgi:undecaprenyl-diphosphatase